MPGVNAKPDERSYVPGQVPSNDLTQPGKDVTMACMEVDVERVCKRIEFEYAMEHWLVRRAEHASKAGRRQFFIEQQQRLAECEVDAEIVKGSVGVRTEDEMDEGPPKVLVGGVVHRFLDIERTEGKAYLDAVQLLKQPVARLAI